MAYGSPWALDDAYAEINNLTEQLSDANERVDILQAKLDELRDYFAERADCDCDERGFIPNEAMRILVDIEAVL